MALLTADWTPLGDTFIRKYELYCMGWADQMDLSNYVVAGATYGGPLAIIWDDKKLLKVSGPSSKKNWIFVFTASGQLVSSIKWTFGTRIHMGWSAAEEVLCILEDGAVLVHDLYGGYKKTFSIGQDTKVVEAKIFTSYSGTGIAVVTASRGLFLINSITKPRAHCLTAGWIMESLPTAWAVISEDRKTRVIVAVKHDLFIVDDHSGRQVIPDFSNKYDAIVDIAVSSDNRKVALFTDNGILWMGSSDFRYKENECVTDCHEKLLQMVWCDSTAVVLYWDLTLFVVSCRKGRTQYVLDSPVHLVQEIDAVRIIGSFNHEILERVPKVSEQVLKIGSEAHGAYLFEASKEFQKRSHKADDYIRIVKKHLPVAVEQCIEAASYEYVPTIQRMLIKAAQFGKSFVPGIDPEPYVKTCQKLRILNAVRDYKLGIPLTSKQLDQQTIPVLLERLVQRRHYYLAIQIAKYLKLPEAEGASRILAHWACYKVSQTHLGTEQAARDIANKLGHSPGISYSEIAKKASESGKPQLAIKLLDHETCASKQVPLLIELGETRQALLKAIESGSTDLVYSVLRSLWEHMSVADFQMTIRNYPVAQSLYMKYCKFHQPERLRDMYIQEDDYNSQAVFHITESYKEHTTNSRLSALLSATESFKKAKNEFNATVTEEQHRLLKYQIMLEEKFSGQYRDLSLHDTVYKLLFKNEVKFAEKLQQEFRLPEKRFWWMRIITLAEQGDWKGLQKLGSVKKSPIGYEAFVDTCLKFNNKAEAKSYLPKVKDDIKVKYYVKLGLYEDAAQIAFEQRDDQALLFIQSKCASTNKGLVDQINQMKTQLLTKKYKG